MILIFSSFSPISCNFFSEKCIFTFKLIYLSNYFIIVVTNKNYIYLILFRSYLYFFFAIHVNSSRIRPMYGAMFFMKSSICLKYSLFSFLNSFDLIATFSRLNTKSMTMCIGRTTPPFDVQPSPSTYLVS